MNQDQVVDFELGPHSHGVGGSYHASRNAPDEPATTHLNAAQILDIIQKSYSGWSEIKVDQIKIKRIEAALTNIVYQAKLQDKVQHKGYRKILVRLFGHGTDYLDRGLEEKIIQIAAKEGLGPELIASFEGGRLEQWLDAITIDVTELPKYAKDIAEKLAKFHDSDLSEGFVAESFLFKRLDDWFEKAKNVIFTSPGSEANVALLKKVDFEYLGMELEDLKRRITSLQSPVVMAHNDLQENNVLVGETGKVYFIDFEYGGPNYRGFDFGNHFCEWAIEYGLKTPEGFKITHDNFPTKEQQTEFFTAYKANSIISRDTSIEHLIMEGLVFSLASHLLWGYVCFYRMTGENPYHVFGFSRGRLWGIFQARDSSIEFGFMEYALQRFDGYRLVKEKLH